MIKSRQLVEKLMLNTVYYDIFIQLSYIFVSRNQQIPTTMKKILTAVAALAITTGLRAQGWTLDQCVSYALDNNIQVMQARHQAESSEVDVKQSMAALFPSLTFNSQQQWGFQKVETQSYTTMDALVKNPNYNGSYSLNANVTLFDGGANWRQLKQSRIGHESDILQAQMTANNVQVQIIQAYYQILYAHESVSTNQEIVAVAERELARTRERQALGKGTKVDVAQMESQYQQNLYQLVNAENTEASNILKLKQLLQLAPDTLFSIDYTAFSTEDVMSPIPTVAEAEALAMANLPNMRQAELKVQQAELQEKIAKGGYWPTVSLNAGVSTSNGNIYKGGFATQIGDHMRENIGLSLSLPILDNRRTRSSVDKARIQLANAVLNHEDARLELQNTIATLHLDTQSAQSRYQSAVANERSARESFEMIEERYNVGLESVIDLLTQKNQYLQARQETLQSKYTALLNLEILKFYTATK